MSHTLLERSDVQHYVDSLKGHDRKVEIACNRFAGEFLVPAHHFLQSVSTPVDREPTDDSLAVLSSSYRVSRKVILRRYLDQGWVDGEFYREKVRNWENQQSTDSSVVPRGGDYFANQGTYLGVKYAALAFRGYYQGAFDVDQLAEYLDIKASSIDGLENWLARRLSSR